MVVGADDVRLIDDGGFAAVIPGRRNLTALSRPSICSHPGTTCKVFLNRLVSWLISNGLLNFRFGDTAANSLIYSLCDSLDPTGLLLPVYLKTALGNTNNYFRFESCLLQ